MIPKEIQEIYKKRYNSINHVIFLANPEREKAFHMACPNFLKAQNDLYIGPNNTIWKVAVVSAETQKQNIQEAIIDATIELEAFENIIEPMCNLRCVRIEFFE